MNSYLKMVNLSQQRRRTKNTWLPSQFFGRKWWSEEESQASERKMISQVTVVSYRYQSIAPSVCFIFFFEFHSFQSIIHHFSFHLTKHTIINFVSIKGSQRKPHKQHFSFFFFQYHNTSFGITQNPQQLSSFQFPLILACDQD